MRPPFLLSAVLAAALAAAVAGCADDPQLPPPNAEFLLVAGDSTYWVRPASTGLRLRASPILLARFDGRFHEVYVTDDERSFEDASFIGQRVWRRDLVRGDSVLVFEDTLAAAMARRWAAEHLDARLLEPTEFPPGEPLAAATVELSVVAVHGPYLSLEYHADVEPEDDRPWHTTRRGVVDLRNGREVTVSELFGQAAARRAVAAARRSYLEIVDSLLQSGDARAAEIAASLGDYDFDPGSFTIGGTPQAPVVTFHVPGRGEDAAGDVAIPLPDLAVPAPRWWRTVAAGLPGPGARGDADEWQHGAYTVRAVRDADRLAVTLLDADERAWRIGTVPAPAQLIHWLDAPRLDSITRHGLRRAFDEAVLYDETMRTASLRTSSGFTYAYRQAGQREPARGLRAHDAPRCEQSRSRLRRGGARDDGQGRRDRGVPPFAHERRHRVDRPRRLS